MICPGCSTPIGHAGAPIVAIGLSDGTASLLCGDCAILCPGITEAFPGLASARAYRRMMHAMAVAERRQRPLTLADVRARVAQGG